MGVLSEVFDILLRLVLPILIIFLILMIIKIVANYLKYGTKIFASFKKYNSNGKIKDIAIDMVKNENRKDTLIVESTDNYFYVINNYGVSAVFVFDYNSSVSGNINDKFLKIDGEEIENPLKKFLFINNKIINNNINLKVIYVNSKKECKLKIDGFSEYIITLGGFSNQLYKNQHLDSIYTIEQMNEMQKKIEGLINGNNKN